jgi:MYXO-CTERM domain-containing protein
LKFSKLAASLAFGLAAQAASAGVITVIVDDFATDPGRSGSFTAGSGTAGVVNDSGYVTSPVYSIAVGQTPTTGSTYTLGYGAIALPTGATATYGFTLLSSDADENGTPNKANGTNLNIAQTQNTAVNLGAYTGGAISIVFNQIATRSWDIVIDNVALQVTCGDASVKDQTLSLTGYASFLKGNGGACGVPTPGPLALLGLGGLAAAFVTRRRTSK